MHQLVPRALRYVVSVSEYGSIQRASREVGIAASAIDRQIIQLEHVLGVQLFERQPSGMSLTMAGERLVLLAKRWGRDTEHLHSEIRQLQGVEQGIVRIAMMDSQVNGLLPICIERLSRDFPRIRVDIEIMSPDRVPDALELGDVDLALAFNLRQQRDIHILWSENLPLGCVVAPSHPLAGKKSVTLNEVAKHKLVLQNKTLAMRKKFEKQLSWIIEESEPNLITNSLQLIKLLIVKGEHVALSSEMDVAPEIIFGSLVFIPIEEQVTRGQNICIAVSTKRSLTRISRLTATIFCEEAASLIAKIRSEIYNR